MSKTWNLAKDPIIARVLCDSCNNPAEWSNSFSDEFSCSNHLPRGCDCRVSLKLGVEPKFNKNGNLINDTEDYEYTKDKKGLIMPCQAWRYSEDGFITVIDEIGALCQTQNNK
jgi:hypothetical protein